MVNKMDDDISDEMVRTTLLARTTFSNERVSEIGSRLRHVTEMMGKLATPPCDGEFVMVVKDNEPQFWHFLQKEKNVIGRQSRCEIELADDSISREHAVIQRAGDDWELIDSGSRNGLRVNGQKLRTRVLCDGDLITIGDYELIFVVNETLEY